MTGYLGVLGADAAAMPVGARPYDRRVAGYPSPLPLARRGSNEIWVLAQLLAKRSRYLST